MKKLISVLTALCLLCTAFAALSEAAEATEPTFSNGISFGMTVDEVKAIAGTPKDIDTEHTHGPVTFTKLEYEKVNDPKLNVPADQDFFFVDGKLVAISFEYKTKDISYDAVKELLSGYGEFTAADLVLLGNGIYAVDDDGTPEKSILTLTDDKVMIVLELDDDGDDIDVTLVDLTADYIK